MNTKLLLIQSAGLAHFGILIASALVPRVLNWRGALFTLPPMLRQLFWVYGIFIVMTIIGFGTLTLAFAPALAAGAPLARGLCAFIAFFWGVRLFVQFAVFDLKPYLTTAWLRWGSHALTLVFGYLVVIYGAAALWPGEVWP
jgi:hypothetical protein